MASSGGRAVGKRARIKHEKTFEERLAEEAIKFREAAEKHPLAAWPENSFCGEPGRPRRHRTSTSGWYRPDCNLLRHWKTCSPIRRSKAASVGRLFHRSSTKFLFTASAWKPSGISG